jgi:hypothetical protein
LPAVLAFKEFQGFSPPIAVDQCRPAINSRRVTR